MDHFIVSNRMASAVPGILAKKIAVAPPPAPPPVAAREWFQNRDGDGGISLTPTGTLEAFIRGPNDSGGNGWSVIYSLFSAPTTISFSYDWSTTDGLNYDWPVVMQWTGGTPFSPVAPDMWNYRYSLVSANSQSGTYSFTTSGSSWVVIGVYSSDSCCGDGRLTVRGLPLT